jgi:hypothetical protein
VQAQPSPPPGTIGGIERWEIYFPKPPKKRDIIFERNMENRDRMDIVDIVKAFLSR